MSIFFTCSSCGKNVAVADLMHPGNCDCGASLKGAKINAGTGGEDAAAVPVSASPPTSSPPVANSPTPNPPPAEAKRVPMPGRVPASAKPTPPPTSAMRSEATSTHHEIIIPERVSPSARTKVVYDEDDERQRRTRVRGEAGFYQRNKPLFKILLVFGMIGGIIAGIGVVVLKSKDHQLGVSSQAPLGVPLRIQAYLESVGLTKVQDGDHVVYGNPALGKDAKGNYYESVFLVFDDEEKLVGVGADFWASRAPGNTSVPLFIETYWQKIGGILGSDRVDTNEVAGTWKDVSGSEANGPFHPVSVRAAIKGSSFEKDMAK